MSLKKLFTVIALPFFFAFLAFALFEIGLSVYYFNKDMSLLKLQSMAGTFERCHRNEQFYPHPNFGHILMDRPECRMKTNNLGTYGEDLPWKKDNEFVILVLGGSVAQQVSSTFAPFKINWIEHHLKKQYKLPGGKEFKVVVGASSGWKQPVQLMQLMQHVGRIDFFVSIEGFHEASNICRGLPVDIPADLFFNQSTFPDVPSDGLRTYLKAQEKVKRSSLLKRSYLINTLLIKTKEFIMPRLASDINNSYSMRHFNYPAEYSKRKRRDVGLERYLDYIEFMDAISLAHKKQGILFLQPIPNLYKKLHKRDWPSRTGLDENLYLELEKKIKSLKLQNLKFKSLLKLYEDTSQWIYVDDVHSSVHFRTGYSLGYDIMGKAVSDEIAKALKLKSSK